MYGDWISVVFVFDEEFVWVVIVGIDVYDAVGKFWCVVRYVVVDA